MNRPFEVRITAAAVELFEKLSSEELFEQPGMMVHRQGPTGELTRAANGSAVWNIERPPDHWKVLIGEMVTFAQEDEDVVRVHGVRVWLPMIPRHGEKGLEVDVRDGELVARTLR